MMLSIVCDQPGMLSTTERPMPTGDEGEVLVRIRRIGICGTDLHIFEGNQPYLTYPRVMGHELAGTVLAAPPGVALDPGDLVAIIPYLHCGACRACRVGRTNCCSKLEVLGVHRDGGMAEYVSVPAAYVQKADGLTLDAAAMVEFLAIGAHAVRRAGVRSGQRVLVAGAGPIGIAAATFACLAGGSVTMLDTRADRLAFCDRVLGLGAGVQVGGKDVEQLSGITNGDFFDVVFDATGNARAMERGFSFVAHAGTYVLVSIVSGSVAFSDPEFHKREMNLLGSRNATVQDFEAVIAAIKAGLVPTDRLATHRMALADVPRLFPGLLDPAAGVVKAVIEA